MKWLFLIFLVFCDYSYSLKAVAFYRNKKVQIREIQIIGERCSGTCYIGNLLKINLDDVRVGQSGGSDGWPFSHKHFHAWWGFPYKPNIYRKIVAPYDSTIVNFDDLEDRHNFVPYKKTLFVYIVRNPYDWIRSFYHWQHAAKKRIREFSSFIRKPWVSNTPLDHHPLKRRSFKDIFELRSMRLLSDSSLIRHKRDCYIVRYETLKEDYEGVIKEIATLFNLKVKDPISNYNNYKYMKNVKYVEKEYFSFHQNDLDYINHQINWDIEKFFGYSKITNP